MSPETPFRAAFWILMLLVGLMRVAFIMRMRRSGGQLMPDQAAIQREGGLVFAFRLLGFFLLVGLLILYAVQPTVVEVLTLRAPDWLRWAGFAVGLGSLAFWTWVQVTLGTQWSAQLRLRESHHLITSGPYANLRHPMYTAISGFGVALALLTSNVLFILIAVLVIVGLMVRVPREEKMMMDAFGPEYQAYMKQAGRFFPHSIRL